MGVHMQKIFNFQQNSKRERIVDTNYEELHRLISAMSKSIMLDNCTHGYFLYYFQTYLVFLNPQFPLFTMLSTNLGSGYCPKIIPLYFKFDD